MPTGYTSYIQDGKITELKDFMLLCAKNFGALIHMRDENLDCEIKHRQVGEFYPRKLEEVKREFEWFKNLSDSEIQKQLDKEYEARVRDKKNSLKGFDERKKRYTNMIEKVMCWTPPTEDHIRLKEFALQQLKDSLKFDCCDDMRKYYLEKPKKETLEEYKQEKIKEYLKDVEVYAKKYRSELESVEYANKWIDDLINSFKQ